MTVPVDLGAIDAHLVVRRDSGFTLDATLAVQPGETVAVVGPNGAGKTTVLQSLVGMVPLDAGHIGLGSRTLDDPAEGVFVPTEHRQIGIVFQDYVLFPHLTVLDNVAFGLRTGGGSRREARAGARDWLERLGLENLADLKPGSLSGGQSQQVALARALAPGPRALLLDEPLAALDATSHAWMRRQLSSHLATYPGPRVLVTHDPFEAFLLGDRIVVLEEGRSVQQGSPEQLRLHPATAYVADLVGVNLIPGDAASGEVDTGTAPPIRIADTGAAGPVLLTIHPRAISLYPEPPHGSPRNTWQAEITAVEDVGERIRVELGPPHPLTVELTPAARHDLHLERGSRVWVAIKATEITVHPA